MNTQQSVFPAKHCNYGFGLSVLKARICGGGSVDRDELLVLSVLIVYHQQYDLMGPGPYLFRSSVCCLCLSLCSCVHTEGLP